MTDHRTTENGHAVAWTSKGQTGKEEETQKGQSGTERTVQLSARLTTIANMVSYGKRVCDVGCDHGFVSIYLVQKGIAPLVLAMDVGEGPLAQAAKHVEEAGLNDRIITRLSDGLTAYREYEAECLVIAGMGGPLMSRILSDAKALTFTELVLAPQSEIPQFRRFLDEHGFCIVDEDLVYEDGKYYPVMKAVPHGASKAYGERQRELGYRFGELLLARKHPVLRQYLHKEQEKLEEILSELENKQGERIAERRNTLQKELYDVEKALEQLMRR